MNKKGFNYVLRKVLKFILFIGIITSGLLFLLSTGKSGLQVFGYSVDDPTVGEKVIDPKVEEEMRKNESLNYLSGEQGKLVSGKQKHKPKLSLTPEELFSQNVCLMDAATGEIVYSLKDNQVVYPASLTKMMTTLVAVKEIQDYDQKYIIRPELYEEMIMEDASLAGYLPDEAVTYRDLVYGTMLPSGGEAAVGLAEAASGSEAVHVDHMNDMVKSLGLRKTHFTNVTGLHNDQNVSTAKELAEIVRKGLQDETFKKIFTTDHYISSQTEQHPHGVYMMYSVIAYMDQLKPEGYKVLGGKTGYTEQAGLCLASTAIVGGRQFILVTLGALPNDAQSKYHFADADYIYTKLSQLYSN